MVGDELIFLGNWNDDANDRALPYQTESHSRMSSLQCQSQCLYYGRDHGLTMRYVGVQNGDLCFCGSANDNYQRHGQYADQDLGSYYYPTQTGAASVNSVYEIASSAVVPDETTIHACRPARMFRQWQPAAIGLEHTIALCQGWPCNGCGNWQGEGASQQGCGRSQYGGGPGGGWYWTGTCPGVRSTNNYRYLGEDVDWHNRVPSITVLTCSGFVSADPSHADWGGHANGQGQGFLVLPMIKPCEAGTEPSWQCTWTWDMVAVETHTNIQREWNEAPDQNNVLWQLTATTTATKLCESHAAHDTNQCRASQLRANNTQSGTLCTPFPSNWAQWSDDERSTLTTLCYPSWLLRGSNINKGLTTTRGQDLEVMFRYGSGSCIPTAGGLGNALCTVGYTQWSNWESGEGYNGVFPGYTTAGGGTGYHKLLSIRGGGHQWGWASGTEGVPMGGWGSANSEQQAPRGFQNNHLTCGSTPYVSCLFVSSLIDILVYRYANNTAFSCDSVWTSSLMDPPRYAFVDGLLWPKSHLGAATGYALFAPSDLRSSMDPNSACSFTWSGVCANGSPATNDATMTLCCVGYSSLCVPYSPPSLFF